MKWPWRQPAPSIAHDANAALDRVLDKLDAIERRLDAMEHFAQGAQATHLGGNRVLVKCVVAGRRMALMVEADDLLLSPWFIVSGGYETGITNYLVKTLRPDSRCVDVGANFGYFTCLMARFAPQGRVIGIEADRPVQELARDNVHINGFQDVARVVHAAAADGRPDLVLHRRHRRSGTTSMIACADAYTSSLGEAPSEQFTAPAIRIDDLADDLGGRLDVLKIDIEGAELLALRGAVALIRANPQLAIVMEWSPGQMHSAGFEPIAVVRALEELGLRAADIDETGALSPLALTDLPTLPYRAGILLTRR